MNEKMKQLEDARLEELKKEQDYLALKGGAIIASFILLLILTIGAPCLLSVISAWWAELKWEIQHFGT